MEIQLNKIKFIFFKYFLLICLFSCNGQVTNNDNNIAQKKFLNLESEINFLDKKYFTGYYLLIDESNISEHPFSSYLDCDNEGYFTVHFVPKDAHLRNYWGNEYYKNFNFNNIDSELDKYKIGEKLKDNFKDYNIFSYHIKKEYLNKSNGCTEESIFTKNGSIAIIYLYNQNTKKWEMIKQVKTDMLPPYADNDFFIKLFPNLFSFFKITNVSNYLIKNGYKDYGVLQKIEKDINNDGLKDLLLVLYNKTIEENYNLYLKEIEKDREVYRPFFIFLRNNDGTYIEYLQNKKLIPCLECGNGAESFYDLKVNKDIISFGSSFKSGDNGKAITFIFKKEQNIYLLNKIEITNSKMGDEKTSMSFLTSKDFGILSLKDFDYYHFFRRWLVNE